MKKFALTMVLVALAVLLQSQLRGAVAGVGLLLLGACEYLTNAVAVELAEKHADEKTRVEMNMHLTVEAALHERIRAAEAERDEAQEQAAAVGLRVKAQSARAVNVTKILHAAKEDYCGGRVGMGSTINQIDAAVQLLGANR